MKLDAVSIERFRSIKSATLENCGGFNVLIGKNNSGKSNILAAIDSFFSCISDKNVVNIRPPIGREIDFFEKRTDRPISVILTFTLSEEESLKIVDDIVTDAPQMKHALEDIGPETQLQVTLQVPTPAIERHATVLLTVGRTALRTRPERRVGGGGGETPAHDLGQARRHPSFDGLLHIPGVEA